MAFDRYGFPVNERNTRALRALEDPAVVRKENNRLVKWQDMFDNWELYNTKMLPKLEKRAWKGIPDPVRSEVWKRRSAAPHAISSRKYQRLLQRPLGAKQRGLIEMDVQRTFPTHEFFLKSVKGQLVPDVEGQGKLANILHAYAVLDGECGYVQGMSYIAAVPLFYMVEEDAFWVFVYLMQHLGYREYFLPGTPQLLRTTDLLDKLIATNFPRLHAHMAQNGILLQQFVSPWFLTIFTFSLPFPVALRCWDWLFVIGHDALIAVALTIFKLKQSAMLAARPDDLLEMVMKMAAEVDVEPLEFVKAAQQFHSIVKDVQALRGARTQSDEEQAARDKLWQAATAAAMPDES